MLRIYSCNECTGPLHFYSSRLQRGVNEKLLPKNPILYIVRIYDSTCFVKKILQGYHGILTVTKAFLRSTRGVKLHSYGLLRRLMAVWLRAHDVQRFSPCTHCVLKALTMLTECIRNSCDTVTSERTPRGLRASSIDLSLRLYCNYMRYLSART